jgi:hypothetical protein
MYGMGGDDFLGMDSSDKRTESHRQTDTKNERSYFAIVTANRRINQRGIIFVGLSR